MSSKPALYLLFNHTLTAEQEKDAYLSLGIKNITTLPDACLSVWKNISPSQEKLIPMLSPIKKYLKTTLKQGDYLLVQGDFGATYIVVQEALALGVVPVYATTKRHTVEKKIEGKTIKTSIFEHVMFRKYGA